MPLPRAYSTLDVSRMCQVDPATVARWCDLGRLKCFRTPGGHRRIIRDNLLEFLREHQMPVPGELGPSRPLVLAARPVEPFSRAFRAAARQFADILDIQQVSDVVTALLRVAAERPEMLLVSLDHDGCEPLEVIRGVRRNPATRPIRVVALGDPQSEAGKAALKAGAAECVGDPGALLALLKRTADVYDEKNRRRFGRRRILSS